MDQTTPPLPAAAPSLDQYIPREQLADLICRAKIEDLGQAGADLTSDTLIPATLTGQAVIRTREPGRLAGVALLPAIAETFDPAAAVKLKHTDASPIAAGDIVATLSGPVRSLLTIERTALNFITHLSGIATLTAQYVAAVAGTPARIYDTRKTLPGLRALQKYAVACGGGHNHRFGLHDAVLIKDNHLAHLPHDQWAARIRQAVESARAHDPPPSFVQIEVDDVSQLQALLECFGPADARTNALFDIVLLDNMAVDQLTQAVALRDRLAPRIELEASGGLTLKTVAAVAATGVDRLSIGALTHSAPALDLGMDIDQFAG